MRECLLRADLGLNAQNFGVVAVVGLLCLDLQIREVSTKRADVMVAPADEGVPFIETQPLSLLRASAKDERHRRILVVH